MQLSNKNVVVTGGATGIGAALVKALIKQNNQVIIADFDIEGAQTLADSLGKSASAIEFDAASVSSIQAMTNSAWQKFNGIDAVFANAGVNAGAPLLQATEQQFDWQFAVNVRGVWATAKEFANRMAEANRPGHIIMTASEHSLGLQHTGSGVYTGTKQAILGIADVMRNEVPDNIAISVLCPGIVATQLYDTDRFGVLPKGPEDMKDLASRVMAKGMSAEQVAQHTLAAVADGDFYIVTHAISFAAADARHKELQAAFAKQAPMTEGAEKYAVPNVINAVLQDLQNN